MLKIEPAPCEGPAETKAEMKFDVNGDLHELAGRVGENSAAMRRIEERAFESGCVSMVPIIPPGESGNVVVRHREVTDEHSVLTAMRGTFEEPMLHIPSGKYVVMDIDGEVMMSDTPFEQSSCADFLNAARGTVLILGLGIGMILVPLSQNDKVESVLVLEKNTHVIDLVAPSILRVPSVAPKVAIVRGDAFDTPDVLKDRRFDVVYLDIWPTLDTRNVPVFDELREKYTPFLKPGGEVLIWSETETRIRRGELDIMKMAYAKNKGMTLEEVNAELEKVLGCSE
jgi:predicted methyltransferase